MTSMKNITQDQYDQPDQGPRGHRRTPSLRLHQSEALWQISIGLYCIHSPVNPALTGGVRGIIEPPLASSPHGHQQRPTPWLVTGIMEIMVKDVPKSIDILAHVTPELCP